MKKGRRKKLPPKSTDRGMGFIAFILPEAEGYNQLMRIPAKILPGLEYYLRVQKNFAVAWLRAVRKLFPRRSLFEIIQQESGLFPDFLRTMEWSDPVQDYLVLRNGDVIVPDVQQSRSTLREDSRETELDAFRACRFKEGFASAGMLCNEPPIPLRVLDFLDAHDLIRLSLVCKAAHQAAHVLFMRENAVADRIQAMVHPKLRSRTRIQRDVRIASLLHGTPEAIPVWEGALSFLPTNTAHDPCHVSLDWATEVGGRHSPIYHVADGIRYVSARRLRVLDRMDVISILEKPQLEAVLEKVALWLTRNAESSIPLDVEVLVRAAIQSGQPVLLRQWWKRRAKRKRLE